MKTLLIFFGIILIINTDSSSQEQVQIFSLRSSQIDQNVKITLDEKKFHNAMFVVKEFSSELEGVVLQENNLYLIGEYQKNSQGHIILNYEKFNYFFVSTIPDEPFYWINKRKIASSGVLVVNEPSYRLGSGDITYWCTCGGHGPEVTHPGDCLASLENNIVRCHNEGYCLQGCIGSAIEGILGENDNVSSKKIKGGGLLIQTSREIFHDYRIGN